MSDSKSVYACPMHPEIRQDQPGQCPLCGMALAPLKHTPAASPSLGNAGKTSPSADYTPLAVLFLLIMATSAIASRAGGPFSWDAFALHFMTGFFLVFAGFKLMDLKGFAQAYATYDLLAMRVPPYAYLYPFLELSFGLLMLAGFHPDWLLWTEFGLMVFSGLGVALKLAKRQKIQCACLGTFLKVPLTTVTLFEDFGMAALALLLLF